jgi:hypothetical protein
MLQEATYHAVRDMAGRCRTDDPNGADSLAILRPESLEGRVVIVEALVRVAVD